MMNFMKNLYRKVVQKKKEEEKVKNDVNENLSEGAYI